jgi:hypothetical protein
MNMKLTSLLKEQRSLRITVGSVSFLVKGHENRLYMIPETTSDLDMIDSRGKDAFIQDEVFPFLESSTGIQWQYDEGNPGTGLVFEVDFDAIVERLGKS